MIASPATGRLGRMLREHASFFLPYSVFLVIAGIFLLASDHGAAIFLFNRNREVWMDHFFAYFTLLGDGLLFLPAIFVLLFVRYRYALVLPVLGLLVSLFTQGGKRLFGLPRPYAYFRDNGLLDQIVPIDGIDRYTGMNSFPSGHTMTAFALFAFLALCLPGKRWGGLFFFALALLVGLSRVYLVHHFLEDVYLGSILGVMLAVGCFWVAANLPADRLPWLDARLTWPSREKGPT